MLIDTTQYKVSLDFADNETEVVMETISITNERQKVEANLTKLDSDTNTALEGVVFNLTAIKDIYSYDGKLLVKAGTLIEQGITGSDGGYIFKADLPISLDEETYFSITEEKQLEGYYKMMMRFLLILNIKVKI